jgi:hypothetical protein
MLFNSNKKVYVQGFLVEMAFYVAQEGYQFTVTRRILSKIVTDLALTNNY